MRKMKGTIPPDNVHQICWLIHCMLDHQSISTFANPSDTLRLRTATLLEF